MGLFENMANNIKENREKNSLQKEKLLECSKDMSLQLKATFGFKELGIPAMCTLRQRIDGTTYFGINDDVIYRIVGYEWNGPIYDHITNSNTAGNSTTEKKGKSGKMATGAIIGTLLMPGVGTAVGAAIGAGAKSKSKTNSNSNTHTVSSQSEKDSTAIIKLKNVQDGTIHSLTVNCNTQIDSKIRCFIIDEEKNTSDLSKDFSDSLKGIKALKELLDMGAITEEEFEQKKQQLLNL